MTWGVQDFASTFFEPKFCTTFADDISSISESVLKPNLNN